MSLKSLMVLLVFLGAFVMVIVLQGQNVISVTMHPTGQVDPTATATPAATPVVVAVPTPTPLAIGGEEPVATVPPLPTPAPSATPIVIVVPDPIKDDPKVEPTATPIVIVEPTPVPTETPIVVTVDPLPETTAVVDPQVAVEGSIEYIDDKNICVRAANPDNPTTRPFVSVAIGGQVMASARVAANGLVQFDYAMLKNWYNGGAAAERPYQVAVTVIDPETKEARPVWETNEFLTPDYDLTKGEVEVTNWTFRRTARGKGTLTVWMKSERAGRAAYRLTGPAQTAARVWWRRPVTAYKGTGVLARNEGSDVFTTQLKDFPVEYRDYPRLFVAQGENYKRLFRIPYADDCYYGNGAPTAAVAQTTVAAETTSKLSAD